MGENICRICVQQKETLFSLFRKIKGASPYEKLVNKTKLKIEINDSGPSSICYQCLVELDTTVSFLDKCENSNRVLSSRLISNRDDCDLRTDDDVKSCEQKEDEKHFLLSPDAPECSINVVENSEKVVKKYFEEVSESPTPAATEAARCPQCSSLRRCRHWAPPSTHTCPHCQKVFTRKFNFKLHVKRHLGERDFPCPSCGVKMLTRGLAQRHCEPRRRRICPVPGCEKSFTSNTNLTTHLRAHTGERPHICTECGKSFTSKNTLQGHIRIHTGAKPYICPVCGKQFTTNKLAAHLRAHGGLRAHACPAPACARAFASRRALRLHQAAHADPAARERHACALCHKLYAHSQSLRKHLRRAHAQTLMQDPQT